MGWKSKSERGDCAISGQCNTLVILGATASGKTALGVRLADALGGEVLSVDSRQVYRGLDIGSGKDLGEYVVEGRAVPYHLIDIAGLEEEFSVFHFQRAFFEAWGEVRGRGKLPVACGGTGLYLEAALARERMVAAPEDAGLRAELAGLDDAALAARLGAVKGALHNVTDLETRERTVRAIEIAEYARAHPPEAAPEVKPLILGTLWPREELRARIARRLRERMEAGLIEEVEGLHAGGVGWARLEQLGLEYKFVAQYLKDEIRSRNDLYQKLNAAIGQFAKRQETWFRRMERQEHVIHWVERGDFGKAMELVRDAG